MLYIVFTGIQLSTLPAHITLSDSADLVTRPLMLSQFVLLFLLFLVVVVVVAGTELYFHMSE